MVVQACRFFCLLVVSVLIGLLGPALCQYICWKIYEYFYKDCSEME